jgi:hypothetical protein
VSTAEYHTRITAFPFRWITLLRGNTGAAPPWIISRFKGPNIAGLDPDSRELVRLFHPRLDLWTEHFRFDHARLLGLTSIGRATIHVLAMNAADLLLFRVEILHEGATFA